MQCFALARSIDQQDGEPPRSQRTTETEVHLLHAQEWDDDKRFMFGLTCLLDGLVTQVLQARGKEQEQ
jgi:hypothetical protein